MIFQLLSKYLDLCKISFAHAGIGTIVQVANISKINSHQFNGYPVRSQPVSSGYTYPVIYGSSPVWSISFHPFVSFNN